MSTEKNDEERIMILFEAVHGVISGSCYTELSYDDMGDLVGVDVMKDGNFCWHSSKTDLLFDYITRDF